MLENAKILEVCKAPNFLKYVNFLALPTERAQEQSHLSSNEHTQHSDFGF